MLTISDKEKQIQKFWEENKIFEKTLEATKNGPVFNFYDGPPFATGTPHYGHLVASLIKDVVPRYWTMKGYYVERIWGWDCHGLPIENIVEKELNFKSKKEIEDLGVEKFNEACQSKVLMYAEEWKKTISRFGRWVNMDDAYRTMDLKYMESIWYVFKELWNKDLIYEGYKSMHVCPRCETTLSQSEVTEGYRDIKDISLTAKFELADEPGTFVLAWTTTPWTLPGNVALAVGEEIEYIQVSKKQIEPGEEKEKYILAKERSSILNDEYKIEKEFKGRELVGKKYLPLFPYYQEQEIKNKENLYTIVSANFVTTTDGTGVVHIAPAYGEEDMVLGKEKNLAFIQNITLSGNFKDEVEEFKGMNVKPAEDTKKTDRVVIEYLRKKDLLFSTQEYEHSYPHCWRCDTPLINYATSSWFVKVTAIKEKALELAKDINWFPGHMKEGRFGKWLEGARDWSISRQRFWASAIPIWRCECGEIMVFGSFKDLEK
ncbi:MAG: class I tRNA ligase family protein, partial [Patescibacteria group bacterium]